MTADSPILITGGTGQQGRAAARAFAERGWRVRILTRDPSSQAARALGALGCDLVVGDVGEPESIGAAMRGVRAVFCVVPLVTSFMEAGAFATQYQGTVNVVDAAVVHSVDHFVLSSANSADLGINPNTDNKHKMERYLNSTELRATVLRPCAFMDNFALPQWGLHQGVFTSALFPTTPQQLISTKDIGQFAAIALADPPPGGVRTLEIAADELTPGEMARALSEALGRRIPYVQVPEETLMRFNPNSGRGYSKINQGALRRVDLNSMVVLNPKLLSFPAWLETSGANQLRVLLPQYRPGGLLDILPTWRLEALQTNHEPRTRASDQPVQTPQ